MMHQLLCILALILHVHSGQSIQTAVDSARTVYAERGERTTILIEPGTYQEQLTIDVPGLKLKNASRHPSIALRNGGVDCDPNAVRISWYYGHGYQYKSMDTINYGGSRSRRWNASVLVTAPDFYAENIIFENSFNLYVSEREAQDSLYVLPEYTARPMPERPKQAGSTAVQLKAYRERAAALSFTETATHAHLKNCRAVGRQDVLYGDQGASVYWQEGILQGGVDFIFGAMTLAVDKALLIAAINGEKGDKCYIAAGRSEGTRGMLFYKCHIRLATEEELQIINHKSQITNTTPAVWLSRPWRSWGETVWAYTTWEEGIVHPEAWSTGLIQKRPEYDALNPCPNSYEYRSQGDIKNRPAWVKILSKPILPDGTRIRVSNWR
ncbi:MAG: hypothetical protein II644_04750 [Paludibacteraceae bacterium]|nr:hypothetical protein [Paludibacteraceae bacterium]